MRRLQINRKPGAMSKYKITVPRSSSLALKTRDAVILVFYGTDDTSAFSDDVVPTRLGSSFVRVFKNILP